MTEKRKVGRPKLADNTIIKESIVMVSMCVVIMMVLLSIGINNPSLSSIKGSLVKQDDCTINTYKISDISVKLIMKCNNNVKSANLMGTKLKNYNNELVGYKIISIDSEKQIKYDWVPKNSSVQINKTYVIQNK